MSGRRYRFPVGALVRSTRPLRNGWAELPAGTQFTVLRRYKGYSVETFPCCQCGLKVRMTRVWDGDLEAIA